MRRVFWISLLLILIHRFFLFYSSINHKLPIELAEIVVVIGLFLSFICIIADKKINHDYSNGFKYDFINGIYYDFPHDANLKELDEDELRQYNFFKNTFENYLNEHDALKKSRRRKKILLHIFDIALILQGLYVWYNVHYMPKDYGQYVRHLFLFDIIFYIKFGFKYVYTTGSISSIATKARYTYLKMFYSGIVDISDKDILFEKNDDVFDVYKKINNFDFAIRSCRSIVMNDAPDYMISYNDIGSFGGGSRYSDSTLLVSTLLKFKLQYNGPQIFALQGFYNRWGALLEYGVRCGRYYVYYNKIDNNNSDFFDLQKKLCEFIIRHNKYVYEVALEDGYCYVFLKNYPIGART